MASFEAKIGWKRSRKRDNKNYRSVPFQKNSKKIQKKKKNHYGFISSKIRLEKDVKE